jgi:MFS family permease
VLGVLALVFLLPAWAWLPAPAATHHPQHHDAPDDAPSTRWMLLFSLAYFCGGFGYVITATFIVDIVRNMPAIHLPGPWVWVLMGAIAVPSCFLWDRVSARIGQLPALTLAYALQTASFALTALGTGLPAITLAAVLFGLTVIGTVSLTLSIIGRRFPANPARAMARLTLSYGAAQMLGPLVAGYVGHANGDFHAALLLAAAIGSTGTLISAGLCLAQARRA